MHVIASPVRRRPDRARRVPRSRRRAVSLAAVLLALLGGVLGGPAVSSAAQATLSVTVEGPGRVSGNGISCPEDCVDLETWRDDQPTPRRVLTATSGPGFRIEWTGCQVTANRPNECTATFDELGTEVTARFVDITPPTVAFSGRSRTDGVLLGPLSALPVYEVEATDNVGVAHVEFRDAGTLYDTVTAAPWSADPRPLAGRADGIYVIRATAYDAAGHSTSVERSIVFDGTAPEIAVTGGLDRHTRATSSSIDWSSTDAHPMAASNAECGIRRRPEATYTIVPCAGRWWCSTRTRGPGTSALRSRTKWGTGRGRPSRSTSTGPRRSRR